MIIKKTLSSFVQGFKNPWVNWTHWTPSNDAPAKDKWEKCIRDITIKHGGKFIVTGAIWQKMKFDEQGGKTGQDEIF